MMPGFSFASPGPADGVGSLVSRQVGPRRGWIAKPAKSSGVSIVVGRRSFTCHRYYDQLRLPNVHPTRLRHPARCVVPALLRVFFLQLDRPCGGGLSWELCYRGGLPQRVALLMIRVLEAQETMRLSRVPVSSLDRHALVYDSDGLRNDSP
jgi:hypothetical protein